MPWCVQVQFEVNQKCCLQLRIASKNLREDPGIFCAGLHDVLPLLPVLYRLCFKWFNLRYARPLINLDGFI